MGIQIRQLMNEIITILLAWRMAQMYNKNESKAVYLCANKILKQVEDKTIKSMLLKLANKDTSDNQRIEFIKRLEFGLRKEQLL